jgi:hypothetical protein
LTVDINNNLTVNIDDLYLVSRLQAQSALHQEQQALCIVPAPQMLHQTSFEHQQVHQ